MLVASMALPFMASAQTSAGTQPSAGGEVRNIREATKASVEQKSEDIKTQAEATREQLKQDAEKLREAAKATFKQKREVLEKQMEATREQFKKDMESARESAKKALEQKREEAKKAIEDIKDAKKKETVKRIDKNLGEMNKRIVERYSAKLDQLDKVLVNIVSRANKAEARGLVVTPVRTAIAAASTSIAAVRATLVLQSGKAYVATITTSTPETVRAEIKTIRDSLRNDLRVVETAVKNARVAVHTAATTLASIKGIGEREPNATSTATSTNQ